MTTVKIVRPAQNLQPAVDPGKISKDGNLKMETKKGEYEKQPKEEKSRLLEKTYYPFAGWWKLHKPNQKSRVDFFAIDFVVIFVTTITRFMKFVTQLKIQKYSIQDKLCQSSI